MKVKEIMTRDIISVGPGTSLVQVTSLLSKHAITGVPVVENGDLVGIVTEFDVMKKWVEFYVPSYIGLLSQAQTGDKMDSDKLAELGDMKVKDIMTIDVITADEDGEVEEVAKVIVEKDINPLPVLDAKGMLVGVVSRSDIVRSALPK